MKPIFEIELSVSGYTLQATEDLKNWDDVETSLKREDYAGIKRLFSTKFEFTGRSYWLLKQEYIKNYLKSSSSIVVYSINNSHLRTEKFRCALDYSTFEDDGSSISINAIDNTLAAIIKAKKSVEYEYVVSDLSTNSLIYDRLAFNYFADFISGGVLLDGGIELIQFTRNITGNIYFQSFPMQILKMETPSSDNPIELNSVNMDSSLPPFIKAHSNVTVSISPEFDFYSGRSEIMLTLAKVKKDGTVTTIANWINTDRTGYKHTTHKETYNPSLFREKYDIELSEGDKVQFIIHDPVSDLNLSGPGIAYFTKFSMKVTWKYRSKAAKIDIIPLKVVLKNLLKSMIGEDNYSSSIDGYFDEYGYKDRLSTTYIMAAESARNIPNAKLYTSYKKFCEFMDCEFGYVPVIENDNVTFMHRDKLFKNVVTKDLGKEVSNSQYSVNSAIIYSSVKVGYEKQDYDSINGRDEFRFTNEFSTGLKLTDNALSLISPFRADAYGIEFLVQKRGEDTTDSSSDNDVFIVSCIPNSTNEYLTLYRPYPVNTINGLISPESMFNIQYSPRFMLEANKSYIGACTNLLKFTSSNGNSDISINGVAENSDMVINERLFTVGRATVETSDIEPVTDENALISFEKDGYTYKGYVESVDTAIGKPEAVKYNLIIEGIYENS